MKKKVVLFAGSATTLPKKVRIAPLSLLHISTFLARDNFEVKIISDSLSNDYIADALNECRDSLCLGITAMTGTQISEGLKISRLVKEKYPQLPVVWGGWHPSIMPESTLADPGVDVVIAGQGERRFYEIVKILLGGLPLNPPVIPGVSWKKDGRMFINCAGEIEEMDNFPSIPYHLIDVEKVLVKTEYGNRTLQYISSYGCPFRCSFCIEPIVNKRRWTGLSAERVVTDWKYLTAKYGLDSIAVYDSNFFVDKNRVVRICEGLLRRNINLKWGNVNGRIPQLVKFEKEIWELMEKSGLKMILTGSESGEQEVLEMMDKDARLEDIYRFTELCHEHHIKILFSYMSGMPWSGDPKFNENSVNREIGAIIRQVEKLTQISSRNRFMIYAYTPLPGSKMYQRALEFGFKEPKTLEEWSKMLYSPEDIFQGDGCQQKWITPKQTRLITMLEQYIFGMMDLDAREWIAQDIKNCFLRFIFRAGFGIGNLFSRLRLKFKVFTLPVDYWLFVKLRKIMGVF